MSVLVPNILVKKGNSSDHLVWQLQLVYILGGRIDLNSPKGPIFAIALKFKNFFYQMHMYFES